MSDEMLLLARLLHCKPTLLDWNIGEEIFILGRLIIVLIWLRVLIRVCLYGSWLRNIWHCLRRLLIWSGLHHAQW